MSNETRDRRFSVVTFFERSFGTVASFASNGEANAFARGVRHGAVAYGAGDARVFVLPAEVDGLRNLYAEVEFELLPPARAEIDAAISCALALRAKTGAEG